jgi:hypothetical protein
VLGDPVGLGDGERLGRGVGGGLGVLEGDLHGWPLAPEPDGAAHGFTVGDGDG